MYATGKSNSIMCANYYVPLQNNEEETPSFTKKRYSNMSTHRAVRILSRRYALTATGYKFLEIGINVGSSSYVEIVIGDNRGNELILSPETWKGLYEQRWNIQNLLQDDSRDVRNFISVGPLTVKACIMNDVKLIRLESSNVRLMMTEATLNCMYNFDRCIDLAYDQLVRMIEKVDVKFARFSSIASNVPDKDISNAIYASDYFDKNDRLDCEMLALVFSA